MNAWSAICSARDVTGDVVSGRRAVVEPRVGVEAHVHDVESDVPGVGERGHRLVEEEEAGVLSGPDVHDRGVGRHAADAEAVAGGGDRAGHVGAVPPSSTSAGSMQVATSHRPSMAGMSMVKLRLSSCEKLRRQVRVAGVDAGVDHTHRDAPAGGVAPGAVAAWRRSWPCPTGDRRAARCPCSPCRLGGGRRSGRSAGCRGALLREPVRHAGRLVPTEWFDAAPDTAGASRTSSRNPVCEELTSATPVPSVTSSTVPPASVMAAVASAWRAGSKATTNSSPAACDAVAARAVARSGADRDDSALGAAPAASDETTRATLAPTTPAVVRAVRMQTPSDEPAGVDVSRVHALCQLPSPNGTRRDTSLALHGLTTGRIVQFGQSGGCHSAASAPSGRPGQRTRPGVRLRRAIRPCIGTPSTSMIEPRAA